MNYNKIRSLQKTNKVSNREIATEIGMSDTGYGKMLDNETCDIKTIEKIAKYFRVSVSFFFDEKDSIVYPSIEKLNVIEDGCGMCTVKDAEISKLKSDLMAIKDKYIYLLEYGEAKKENGPQNSAQAG